MFWPNRLQFLNSTVKLDLLEIEYSGRTRIDDLFLEFLNQLYENKFYKRLHLKFHDKQHKIQKATLHGLQQFSTDFERITNTNIFFLPFMSNLKQLHIEGLHKQRQNIVSIVKSLVKLEQVLLSKASFEDIWLFTRYSPNLIKLKIDMIFDQNQFNHGAFNLHNLNEEREKLQGARKLTIYLPDYIFVTAKEDGLIDLSLVELKRTNSFL